MDSAIKGGIKDLTERALSFSDDRLKSNPRDAEALYNRGITEGLRFTYLVIVEHSSGSRDFQTCWPSASMVSSNIKPPSPSTARHKKRKGRKYLDKPYKGN
jgi:hypothetical protein